MGADPAAAPGSHLPVRVYSPEPLLSHWWLLLKAIFSDLHAGRELAWRLFLRDLSAQYRQTFFGYIWAFLPPLAAAVPFIFLNSQGIINLSGSGIPFPAFAMMGTLLWQVFVDSFSSPAQALTMAKPMLAKINFPREAVLLGGMYMVFFNFLVRLLLLAGVMTWWKVAPGGSLLFFPLAMFGLMLTGFALGLLIAPLAGFYGDVMRAVPIFSQFWMLLTPVVYPARTEGLAGWLAVWNPVSPLITTAREALTGQALTQLPGVLLVTGGAALVAFLGLLVFRLAMPHLIARMGG